MATIDAVFFYDQEDAGSTLHARSMRYAMSKTLKLDKAGEMTWTAPVPGNGDEIEEWSPKVDGTLRVLSDEKVYVRFHRAVDEEENRAAMPMHPLPANMFLEFPLQRGERVTFVKLKA